MSNVKVAGMTSALAVVACLTGIAEANAQAIYSGGASLPSKVYRQLADCWGVPANTTASAVPAGCASPSGDVSGKAAMILYQSVGSGNGKRAFRNNDGSNSTSTGLGNTPSSFPPYTSALLPATQYPYPHFHFAGSDDVLTATDVSGYNAAGLPAKAGNIIQIPAMVTSVAVVVNGKDGNGANLNITNSVPAGGSSGLNLSRQAVCGIFSGHITKWDNPILTALNGGTPLGTGQITVVHRSDGSGTTFLFTNALVAQCASEFGRNSETDATNVSYAFPFSDKAPSAPCPAVVIRGANAINWPDTLTNQCGAAIVTPPGSAWANGSGSSGVQTKVLQTNGAIGYLSPDFAKPVDTAGPIAANVPSQYDIDNATGLFQPPTAAGATAAMSAAAPPADVTKPLYWSNAGVVPNPYTQNSYPFSGFTWLDLYQCYADTANADIALSQSGVFDSILSYLTFHYSDPSSTAILNANGFSQVPSNWIDAIVKVVTTGTTAMNKAGTGACVGKPGV